MRNGLAAATVLVTVFVANGCAKPIEMRLYGRTPPGDVAPMLGRSGSALRVGMGCEAMVDAEAFISHAQRRRAFAFVGWARPDNLDQIDCQIDCKLSYRHEGNKQLHYCLGSLVVNVYNPDHSRLLLRVMRFHEAMYTTDPKNLALTHDGQNVQDALREALFDELIQYLSHPATTEPAQARNASLEGSQGA